MNDLINSFRKVFGEVEEVEPYRSLRFLNLTAMSRRQWVIEQSIILLKEKKSNMRSTCIILSIDKSKQKV